MGSTVVAVSDTSTTRLTYLFGDQHGSTTVSVNAAGGTPVVQRYLPHGAQRSSSGTPVTDPTPVGGGDRAAAWGAVGQEPLRRRRSGRRFDRGSRRPVLVAEEVVEGAGDAVAYGYDGVANVVVALGGGTLAIRATRRRPLRARQLTVRLDHRG
jgi:hypothetical protein